MRILTLGDVVGTATIPYLREKLWSLRKCERIDFTVANGENATDIHGIASSDAAALLDTGVDLITLGNHAFRQKDIYPYLDAHDDVIIRPANYPPECPGVGYTICRVNGFRMLCINVCGRVYLDPLACPFETIEKILERQSSSYDFALLDIHAEASSEKLALAHAFDGRVQIIFGTHTHVPTADEQILPCGSGYITDLGMCGPHDGILGTNAADVIHRMRTMMPTRWNVARGEIVAMGAIFDLDENTGRVRSVKRITF